MQMPRRGLEHSILHSSISRGVMCGEPGLGEIIVRTHDHLSSVKHPAPRALYA